jgi:hypothetical protein
MQLKNCGEGIQIQVWLIQRLWQHGRLGSAEMLGCSCGSYKLNQLKLPFLNRPDLTLIYTPNTRAGLHFCVSPGVPWLHMSRMQNLFSSVWVLRKPSGHSGFPKGRTTFSVGHKSLLIPWSSYLWPQFFLIFSASYNVTKKVPEFFFFFCQTLPWAKCFLN